MGNSDIKKAYLELLAELENDARQNLSQISENLKISRQLTGYKLNQLLKKDIVCGFFTIINFRLLGYTNYRTMVRLRNITKSNFEAIISYLMKHPNVQWIVECGGRWDLIVNYMAKDIIQYNQFLKKLKGKFPEQIQDCDVFMIVELIDFGREYLSNKERRIKSLPYFGNKVHKVEVDEIDLKILNLLSENARISALEIGDKLSISTNTVIKRIETLKKRKIILGFRPFINLEKTPFSAYKAATKLQNITEDRENEMIDYLKKIINISAIVKLIGPWDFEIEFEVNSREAMSSFTKDFRDKFKDVIKEFEIVPLFKEYKFNFFPGDLL